MAIEEAQAGVAPLIVDRRDQLGDDLLDVEDGPGPAEPEDRRINFSSRMRAGRTRWGDLRIEEFAADLWSL